jgi:hypothetical protein
VKPEDEGDIRGERRMKRDKRRNTVHRGKEKEGETLGTDVL